MLQHYTVWRDPRAYYKSYTRGKTISNVIVNSRNSAVGVLVWRKVTNYSRWISRFSCSNVSIPNIYIYIYICIKYLSIIIVLYDYREPDNTTDNKFFFFSVQFVGNNIIKYNNLINRRRPTTKFLMIRINVVVRRLGPPPNRVQQTTNRSCDW